MKKIIITIILILLAAIAAAIWLIAKEKTARQNRVDTSVQRSVAASSTSRIYPLKEVIASTNKTVFSAGEISTTTLIIYNPFPETKKWQAVYYFQSSDNSYSEVGQEKNIELKPGETKKLEFTSIIFNTLLPGQYLIKSEIFERKQLINTKTITIEVRGTDKILTARLNLCADISCQEEKNIFLPGQTIYFKAISDMGDLQIYGRVYLPNNPDPINLDFKNGQASIKINAIGAYEALINLSLNGYQSLSIKKGFAVIPALPVIENRSECSADGKCDSHETKQNCPQDCY